MSEIKLFLRRKKKIVLYLDRRGLYAFMACKDCGYIFQCENCNILVHISQQEDPKQDLNLSDNINLSARSPIQAGSKLSCSYCYYVLDIPLVCPKCEGVFLKSYGVGIKQIARYIQEKLPKAKILAIDKNTKTKLHTNSAVVWQKFDIIIGTQAMLTAMYAIRDIALVAMLNIDISLKFPDFYSGEKTYALVHKFKNIALESFIIQTYNHDSQFIKSIINNDYSNFFRTELLWRKQFHYPPFYKIIKLTYKHSNKTIAETESQKLHDSLKLFSKNKMIEVGKPHQSLIDKIKNKYLYQIFIKELVDMDFVSRNKISDMVPDGWSIDINSM